MNPEPELLGVQIGALMIFKRVADAWDLVGDGMSGFRYGFFHMDLAKQWAEGYGFEWDGDMQEWVDHIVQWYRAEHRRRMEEQAKRAKEKRGLLSG